MLFSSLIEFFIVLSQCPSSIPEKNNNIKYHNLKEVLIVKWALKMKLNFSGIAFLVEELTKSEMLAIYLMGFDREMPDKVTKADLVRIIQVLCRKLDWIEMDPVEELTEKSEDKSYSSSRISEQINDEAEPQGDYSLFGSETGNNVLEDDRNMCANGEDKENTYEIITEANEQ